jgi:hypothetical protein
VAKEATKSSTEIADRIFISKRRDSARQRAIDPIPEMEMSRHAFLPILSARGAHAMVVIRFTIEIMIVRREDDIGRTPDRRETEYIMILFIPQNCWANIIPTTATIAGL